MALTSLPNELLIAILRAVDRDLQTLRNVALASRDLLPVAREQLFRIINIRALEQLYMLPYFGYVEHIVESRLGQLVLENLFTTRYFQPDLLPRLQGIHFIGSKMVCYTKDPSLLVSLSERFTSISELSLLRVVLPCLSDLQYLICSLPGLSQLSLKQVDVLENLTDLHPRPFPEGLSGALSATIEPQLSRLIIGPSRYVSGLADLAAWLGRGPSASSITSLVLSRHSQLPRAVLGHFGPSVRQLSLPLQALNSGVYDGYLSQYTSLRGLSVSLDAYNASPGPWYLLAPFLDRGIPANHLRTITIDVYVEYPMQLSSAIRWQALDQVNEVLEEVKFEALTSVIVAICWRESLRWQPDPEEKETVARNVESRLYDLAAREILATRLHSVKAV
ncbi:hypothetical protein BD414DRAFT_539941 [Trametes punicea]|nr:hypothetical protein BD414DRAFT_539941 [Trametes punicea]